MSWITQHSTSDETFLALLLSLRSHVVSSVLGHYLALRLGDIAPLFGGEKAILGRLECISADRLFPEQTEAIRTALAFSESS